MSVLAVPLMIAGAAVTAISQIKQGQAQSAAAEYNVGVAESQKKVIQKTSAFETKTLEAQSALEQSRIAREKALMTSTQKARYAKAGVRIMEGSPLEVMADTAAQYELDLSANRYNLAVGKERIRYGRDVGVAQTQSEAAYQKLLAKQYERAGYYGAASTLLTTGGQLAYYKGTQKVKNA